MPSANGLERSISSDGAKWKQIQENTFTRWVNEHLRKSNLYVYKLESDFADGLLLINLIQALSGKKFPRYNKKTMHKQQQLENVSIALRFLEEEEGIHIVNIDSSDIVDQNLKLILGLVWMLILHYSISSQIWENEENGDGSNGHIETPKQRLMNWVQTKIPNGNVRNFTGDWRDGRYLGALVDSLAPGLCPDWQDWKEKDSLENTTEAMNLADDWLGVAKLIEPDEMIDPQVDEKSVMTYLAQFPSAKLKEDAPLRSRVDTSRVVASGPGLKSGSVHEGQETQFRVEAFSAGKADLDVRISNPLRQAEKARIESNDDRSQIYAVYYTPQMKGPYTISVRYGNREVPNSPYNVNVQEVPPDKTKVVVRGQGIESTENLAGKPTTFEIDAREAGNGKPAVIILDPSGSKDRVTPSLMPVRDSVWQCEYVPEMPGLHSINVFFNGEPLPLSPFGVKITSACSPDKVRVWGRGVQPRGVRVGDRADFKIFTKGAGDGKLDVAVRDSSSRLLKLDQRKFDDTVFYYAYEPLVPGLYTVDVLFDEQKVARSPFEVQVGKKINSKIRAFGPGLEGGLANLPCDFTVETNGEAGSLGCSVEGPSQATITCHDNEDSTVEISYLPTLPGDYAVHINCDDEDIPGSPFMVEILPYKEGIKPSQVRCYGPGIEKEKVFVGKKAEFTVDCSNAGKNSLKLWGVDEFYEPIEIKVLDNLDGTFSCSYMPKEPVKHTIVISYGGVAVAGSPYRTFPKEPIDPYKVRLYGPGIERNVKSQDPTYFVIDASQAGQGKLDAFILDPKGQKVDIDVKRNTDGTVTVRYVPQTPGKYKIHAVFADKDVPGTPIDLQVRPHLDVSTVVIKGLESSRLSLAAATDMLRPKNWRLSLSRLLPIPVKSVYCCLAPVVINTEKAFHIIAQDSEKVKNLRVSVLAPSRKEVDTVTDRSPSGFRVRFVPTELGDYTVDIYIENVKILDSSLMVKCVPPPPNFASSPHPKADSEGPVKSPSGGVTLSQNSLFKAKSQSCVQKCSTPPQMSELDERLEKQLDINHDDDDENEDRGKAQNLASTCNHVPHELPPKESSINSDNDASGLWLNNLRTSTNLSGDSSETPGVNGVNCDSSSPADVSPSQTDCGSTSNSSASLVRVYGEGLSRGFVNDPSVFLIDTRQSGSASMSMTIEGVFVDSTTEFEVDCRSVTPIGKALPGPKLLKCLLFAPSGQKFDAPAVENQNVYTVAFTPYEEGTYQLELFYDGVPIETLLSVYALRGHDAGRCKAYGAGVERAQVGMTNTFHVLTKGAGVGGLNIAVEGPSQADIQSKTNPDGSCIVDYIPLDPGIYEISIKFGDDPIPGSPFIVRADYIIDSNKVKIYGNGLEAAYCREDVPLTFHVDASNSGYAPLNVHVIGEKGELPGRLPEIREKTNKTYDITYYAPPKDSQCIVSVTYGGKDVPRSPVKMRVLPQFEPEGLRIRGDGVAPLGEIPASFPTSFTVDKNNAGTAKLDLRILDPEGDEVEYDVTELSDGVTEVRYVPRLVNNYTVDVSYGGQKVSRSPYTLKAHPVGDASKCLIVDGLIEHALVDKKQYITVDHGNAGQGHVYCKIQPMRYRAHLESIPIEYDRSEKTTAIYYTLRNVGEYRVRIFYGGRPIPDGDFKLWADTTDRRVIKPSYQQHSSIVSTEDTPETSFTSSKGPEYSPQKQGSSYPIVQPTVLEHIDQSRSLTQNHYSQQQGSTYPTAPPTVLEHIEESRSLTQNHYTYSVNEELSPREEEEEIVIQNFVPFQIPKFIIPESCEARELTAEVTMPSKKVDIAKIEDNHDGTVTVRYNPQQRGHHALDIKHNDVHVAGTPLHFYVDTVSGGHVTAYGSGLVYGIAGEPATFTVCAKNVGTGGLSVSVEGPAKAEIKCHDNKDGTIGVSWIPPSPGEYKVHVKFADKDIHGSPFVTKVAGEGRKRAHISVGSTSEVSLKIEEDIKGLSASIKSPNGIEEPCFIRKIDNGHLGVSFTPREAGEHLVTVKRDGNLIPKAPFRISVAQNEVGNAANVKITGPGLKVAQSQVPNEFTVDTRQAGFGGLSISVEGPSRSEIQCQDNKDGTCTISYKPTEPGVYLLSVKFADHHVPGSPFTINCSGAGLGAITNSASHKCKLATPLIAGENADIHMKIPDVRALDLACKIMFPDGRTEDAELRDGPNHVFMVRFCPTELGVHTVSILHKEQHVSGSPFQYTVGAMKEVGTHRVRAGGSGLVRGEVNTPSEFNVYCREAGDGELAVTVEGPSKAHVQIHPHKDENCYVVWKPTKLGEYLVAVKFNGTHIPDSPFRVYVSPSSGEAKKLEVTALPDANQVDKPTTFNIRTHGAKGHLDAKVVTPSGQTDDCFVTPIDEGETYACRFIPKEAGYHYVHIKLDDAYMRDSPFRIRVGQTEAAEATAIGVSGSGIKCAETGHKCEFIINTCNAGCGALSVTCDGPSKVTLDAYEVDVGYKVRYTPLAPGDYFFTIKFNGVHVPGSPFKVVTTGKAIGGSGYNESASVQLLAESKTGKAGIEVPRYKSDPDKVALKGAGLKRAYVARQNAFTVDCSKAGLDVLSVGMVGRRGPIDEVFVKHEGNMKYSVHYVVRERAPVFIFVKYGNEHIPGSPFVAEV